MASNGNTMPVKKFACKYREREYHRYALGLELLFREVTGYPLQGKRRDDSPLFRVEQRKERRIRINTALRITFKVKKSRFIIRK